MLTRLSGRGLIGEAGGSWRPTELGFRFLNELQAEFLPEGKLGPAQGELCTAGSRLVPLTLEDYIRRSGPMLEQQGFFEQEIARRSETFGDFAHVWSTYAGRRALADAEPFLRGINSIQLVRQDGRWWIAETVTRKKSVLIQQVDDAGNAKVIAMGDGGPAFAST